MRKWLFFLSLCLGLISCNLLNNKGEFHMATVHSYLALGDSYTIGEAVEQDSSFPFQLRDSLLRHSVQLKPVDVVAKTGWTTDELVAGIDVADLQKSYDLVSLLIGVNNQFRGRDTANYRDEFTALLNRSIRFAGDNPKHVIVLSIPDYGVTPFAESRNPEKIKQAIDSFNRLNHEISQELGVHYVDVTSDSRLAKNDDALLASDGLHPSERMYSLWVHKMIPLVQQILTTK